MKYRFQGPIKAEDYYQFREYHLLHTPEGKKQIRRERISLIWYAVWLAGIFYLYWSTGIIRNRYQDLIIWAVVCVALFVLRQIFLVKQIKDRFRRNAEKEFKQNEKFDTGDPILEFYEDGFVDLSDQIRTEVEYRSLQKAVIYKNRQLFLLVNTRGFVIPFTTFRDEAQAAEVVAFLQSRGVTVETVVK